jgi:hypothetical protein
MVRKHFIAVPPGQADAAWGPINLMLKTTEKFPSRKEPRVGLLIRSRV